MSATTVRTLFEQKKRWLEIVSLISYFVPWASLLFQYVLFLGVSKVLPSFSLLLLLAVIPFLLVAVTVVLYERSYAFLCPRCEKNVDLKALGQNVRYCPFCGLDLDVEIDPESHEPMGALRMERGQSGTEIKNMEIQHPPRKQKANTDIQLPPGKAEGTAK